MSRQEYENMPITLKDRETGKIWKSEGFFSGYYDWNCDGDWYYDKVMRLYTPLGTMMEIHEDDLQYFEVTRK